MLHRKRLAAFVVLVAVCAVVWFGRVWLLRSAADVWIVSDPISAADAVAIFGGGVEDRPFAAADYFRRGIVKKVLVSNVHQGPAERLGAVSSGTAAAQAILEKLGVPESAIEVFGFDLHNTQQEALALLAWAERSGARRVIVPSEIFSARRVRWVLHHSFPRNISICVPALDPPDYRADDWWRNDIGLISFQNEIIKYLYYRIRF